MQLPGLAPEVIGDRWWEVAGECTTRMSGWNVQPGGLCRLGRGMSRSRRGRSVPASGRKGNTRQPSAWQGVGLTRGSEEGGQATMMIFLYLFIYLVQGTGAYCKLLG